MRKVFPIAICVLLFITSCGPSSVELTATANIALQQTQTAAPTKTPTPTLTPTLTPTSTPTVTPTPLGGGGVIAFVSKQGNEGRITLYDIATGKTTYPTIQFMKEVDSTFGVRSVSVSLDGTKLAFTQSLCPVRQPGQKFLYCKNDVFTSNIDGSDVVQITTTDLDEDWPVWSPDGTRIAYVFATSGAADIYVVNVDGSGRTRLTDARGWDWLPTWSPDSRKIAFQSQRNGNFKIYVMNADRSGDVLQLTNIKNTICAFPSWSPDGLRIAFVAYSTKSKTGDIYIMDADGGNQINLTTGRYSEVSSLTWSPDGKMLAFKCDERVCMMSPDGTDIVELSGLAINGQGLSWFMP